MSRLARCLLLGVLLVGGAAVSGAEEELPAPVAPELPPDPFELFSARRSWDPILDAVPPCLPEEVPEALAGVMPFVLEDDESASRRVLELAHAAEKEEGGITPQLHLWIAVLRARTADTRERRRDSIRELARALDWGGEGRARSCAYLARARVELESGFAPEASASAVLALRGSAETPSDSLREGASFVRAEALRLAGRWEDAEPLYRSFGGSENRRIRAASALRLAFHEAEQQEPAEAWASLRQKIDEAREAGLSLDGFERNVAEYAQRAGDTRRALLWITRAADLRGDERTTGLAAVRKADLLAARGRGDDALTILQRLSEVHPVADLRTLARVRIVQLGLGEATEADRRKVLEKATRATEPGLAVNARAQLMQRAVRAGEVDEALFHYARLAYTDPELRFAPGWRADLDAALEMAVDPYCPTTVRRLAGRRELLMRDAQVAEPFIAMADCLLALDMPRPALETYRAVSRSFGAEMAPRLTLRLARASLGVGDLAAVGAAIKAHRAAADRGAEPVAGSLAGDSWALFEAELALREGRKEAAAELLLPLILEPGTPIRAVRWFAELARDGAGPEHAALILQELTARWQLEDQHEELAEERAYVALALADLLRAQGDRAGAHYVYGLAVEGLPEGAPLERARFLLADLERSTEASQRTFEAASQDGGLWGRLAAIELRSRDLREQVALDELDVQGADRIPEPGDLP